MTTSGTSSFNLNRDQIIRAALRKIGAIQAGETPSHEIVQDAAQQLNSMVKYWMASGIHIWTETEAALFVQTGQYRYSLGDGTTDHSAQIYTVDILVNSVPAGTSIINVNSTAELAIGTNIGVTLDAGVIFWATIANFLGTTVTLSAPLPDSCTAGAAVYIASPNIVRPLRIPFARRWDQVSNQITPLTPFSRKDYFDQPNPTNTGTITQFYYDPRGGANNTGYLYLWPAPADVVSNCVKFTWYRPIQDFDIAANTPDLPQEWLNTIIWNLAMNMAPEFGTPSDVYAIVKEQAISTLEECRGWDKEPEPTYFGVDFQMMGR